MVKLSINFYKLSHLAKRKIPAQEPG